MDKTINLFIAYADHDEDMKNWLVKHLMTLKSHKINIWNSNDVSVESNWTELLHDRLKQADIILLLISANFLHFNDAPKSEIDIAIQQQLLGKARVLPIILNSCSWQDTPLAGLQVLPRGGKPLSSFKNRADAYVEIVKEIERVINSDFTKPKWLQVLEHEMNYRTGKLELIACGLTAIPEEVKEMSWLTELNLSSNEIKKIDGLDKLKKLQNLYLDSNQITKIEGLHNLKKLQLLYLHSNQIDKIERLDSLPVLKSLDLSSNQITQIEGLEKLKTLEVLFLTSNKIRKIDGLNKLNKLNSLFLSSNQITKIENIDSLSMLNSLDLLSNQISKIEGLNKLTTLTWLDLSSNQITNIEGLDELTALNSLALSSNQINKIEGLDAFPAALEKLYLFNNPIANINITIFGTSADYNCMLDLRNFFAEDVNINVPEVKLILTGNSDVGKTKLRFYLTTGEYDTTRNSTHGLEVHPYKLEKRIKEQYGFEQNTKIVIWDFGGQEYFHNTHQLFFNQDAVYVFLWEKETNKNEPILTEVKKENNGSSVFRVLEHFDADYWLSNIRHYAPDAVIILAQNKVDKYEPLEWLPHSCTKKYNCKNQYHISIAKSAEKNLDYWFDFQKLKHTIFNELKSFVSKNKEGNVYNKIRKEIERLQQDNYWKVEDFITFIENLKTNSKSINANTIDNRLVIEHFNRQGKVLFPSNQTLESGKVIFTNPQWLSEKIYEILNDAVLQRNGFFDEKDLIKLVTDSKFESAEILYQIVQLMKQYNIVFFNPNKNQYVVPQYLPEVPTVHYSQVKKLLRFPKLIIKLEGFLPKSVINNIIARYAIKDDAASFYKYGVKTEEKNRDILLIEADYPRKSIYIYSDVADAIYLRNVFSDILLEFGITLSRGGTIPSDGVGNALSFINETQVISTPINHIYISIDDKIFVDWIELWNSYRNSDKEIEKDYCIAEDGNIVLRKLFASYYLPYNEVRNMRTNELLKPSKLFISYSSKNSDFMKRLVTHLEPLKRNGTIELWYDRMIEPGTKWDDAIKEEMRSASIIIFLLSPDFIATNYIFEFEIPQAIKQMESTNSKLFFVELQSCSWNRTVLSRFQQTTDQNANNKGVIVIEQPMNDSKWKEVMDELEKKIKR